MQQYSNLHMYLALLLWNESFEAADSELILEFPFKKHLWETDSSLWNLYFLFPQSVEGEHHEKAVELLKAAQGTVKLVVRYTPKVLEEMESRFEKMRSAKRRQQNNYPQ